MTDETIKAINQYCDRYGDKLVYLMNQCGVFNTQDVPEEEGVRYLEELGRMSMDCEKIIAVDFDGTLCEDRWSGIGEPNSEVIDYILNEQRNGAKLILWTNRTGILLMEAERWCGLHKISFNAVNRNIPEIIDRFGGDSRKVFATEYIDDRMNMMFKLPFVAAES